MCKTITNELLSVAVKRISQIGQYVMKLECVAKPSVIVALRSFIEAELLWQLAEIWLPWQQGSVRAEI